VTWLLKFIPTGWLWPAAFSVMGVLTLWGLGEHWRANINAKETQECKDKATLDMANHTKTALEAATKYRAAEAAWKFQLRSAQDEYNEREKQGAKKLAAFAATASAALLANGKLRDDIAAFARGGGPAVDTAAAASDRAARLGLLLSEALRLEDETLLVAAESAGGAESAGNAVRTLLNSWPKDTP